MDINPKIAFDLTKLGLYIDLFIFSGFAFIFLLNLLGFIIAKPVYVIALIVCLLYLSLVISSLSIISKVTNKDNL